MKKVKISRKMKIFMFWSDPFEKNKKKALLAGIHNHKFRAGAIQCQKRRFKATRLKKGQKTSKNGQKWLKRGGIMDRSCSKNRALVREK